MPSWQDTIIIASGVMQGMKGQTIQVNPTAEPVAVWPQTNSTGKRATILMIRPSASMHIGIGAVATTDGPDSAKLAGSVEYVFPLHPSLDTIWLLDAASATNAADLRWIIGRE